MNEKTPEEGISGGPENNMGDNSDKNLHSQPEVDGNEVYEGADETFPVSDELEPENHIYNGDGDEDFVAHGNGDIFEGVDNDLPSYSAINSGDREAVSIDKRNRSNSVLKYLIIALLTLVAIPLFIYSLWTSNIFGGESNDPSENNSSPSTIPSEFIEDENSEGSVKTENSPGSDDSSENSTSTVAIPQSVKDEIDKMKSENEKLKNENSSLKKSDKETRTKTNTKTVTTTKRGENRTSTVTRQAPPRTVNRTVTNTSTLTRTRNVPGPERTVTETETVPAGRVTVTTTIIEQVR